jgi:hypothetical protein
MVDRCSGVVSPIVLYEAATHLHVALAGIWVMWPFALAIYVRLATASAYTTP